MKKTLLCQATCILLSIGLSARCAEKEIPEGFTPIFNGKNLDGWYGNNPHTTAKAKDGETAAVIAAQQDEFKAHWTVEGDELVNDGHGPYATTAKEYGDIEFLIDYKTVAKADSGIYLRGNPQVQIWDYTKEGGKWGRGADRGSGGLFNNSPKSVAKNPLVLADKSFGEWNHFRIRQLGSRTSVWLNDKLVVDNAIMENYWDKNGTKPMVARGPIHLQTHGGEIRWRNIHLREISADEANQLLRGDDKADGFTSVFNGVDLSGWAGADDKYQVRDGAIVCKPGQGGVLHTSEKYDDFVVRLEFKLPTGGNNGLAIRYPGSGNAAYVGMCELQVLDNDAEKYSTLDSRQYHGSAYGMAAAARGYLRPTGQWNYQQVTVNGSTIKVELNGTVILDTDLAKITEYKSNAAHPGKNIKNGYFGFAGHQDPVMFRKISIRKLGK
jgi:hypothetical protein